MRRVAQSELAFDPLERFEKREVEELWAKLGRRRDGLKPAPTREKESGMAEELAAELRETNDKLNTLLDVLSDRHPARRRGRHREEEDEPESVREMEGRGRRGEPTSVSFEIRVPVGRNGGTLKGLVTFADVRIRDDRDIEDLANEVERKFRLANVFTKDFNRGNGNGYSGGYRNGGGYGGGWDREREWRR